MQMWGGGGGYDEKTTMCNEVEPDNKPLGKKKKKKLFY